MEYCERSLRDFIQNNTEFPLTTVKRLFKQLTNAMQFCHTRGVIHRDLKPENILVDSGFSCIKLADFGMGRYTSASDYRGYTLNCTTLKYAAPEILKDAEINYQYTTKPNYTEKVDIWAMGIILGEMLGGATLRDQVVNWLVDDMFYTKFVEDHFEPLTNNPYFFGLFKNMDTDTDGLELAIGLMQKNPTNRWSANKVYLSNWLKGVNSD